MAERQRGRHYVVQLLLDLDHCPALKEPVFMGDRLQRTIVHIAWSQALQHAKVQNWTEHPMQNMSTNKLESAFNEYLETSAARHSISCVSISLCLCVWVCVCDCVFVFVFVFVFMAVSVCLCVCVCVCFFLCMRWNERETLYPLLTVPLLQLAMQQKRRSKFGWIHSLESCICGQRNAAGKRCLSEFKGKTRYWPLALHLRCLKSRQTPHSSPQPTRTH